MKCQKVVTRQLLVRRAALWAACLGWLEVSRGGDAVHGEDNWAAPPAVLGGADEAFGYCGLLGRLPGVAGRLAGPGFLGPWEAVVAIAPAAVIRGVACPPLSRSSTAMAQAALGGCLPLAGHRVAVTLMCTALLGGG